MRASHVEEHLGGERAHPVYTLKDEKEEPIISDLLEESGVNFYIHPYDDDEAAKGFGVVLVAENDLEMAQEVVEEYKKVRLLTVAEPMIEFNEEEGSFMPVGLGDKDDEEEEAVEEDLDEDDDDFDDEDLDDDELEDDDDKEDDEYFDDEADEYLEDDEERE